MDTKIYDIGIIGSGPAGYTAALQACKAGFKVVLFEKNQIGGICLNLGCIPTKTILHSVELYQNVKKASAVGIEVGNMNFDYSKIFERKELVVSKLRKALEMSLKRGGVEIIAGEASILDPKTIEVLDKQYSCENIIIATGSKHRTIKGLEPNGKSIVTSDDILSMQQIPNNILIVGSGAIGIEWARIFNGLDKSVTLIEMADRLLPTADNEVSKRIERIFKQKGIRYFTNTNIVSLGKQAFLSNDEVISFDLALIAVGKEPVLPAGYEKSDNHFIIGDSSNGVMLAHTAIHQAFEAIEAIKTKKPLNMAEKLIPYVIYGNPEIAWVGKKEDEIEGKFKKSVFPVSALGKAYADNNLEGFIKLLSQDDKIIGAHIISKEASSLITTMTLAIEKEILLDELKSIIFPHPTYSEGLYEALLGFDD